MDCKPVKVLVLNTSSRISGAERSLVDVLSFFRKKSLLPLVVLPDKGELYQLLQTQHNLLIVGLLRSKKGQGVYGFIRDVLKLFKHSYQLSLIIKSHNIDLIYSNSASSQLYAILLKVITGRKIIWHVRDNLKTSFFTSIFCYFADKMLCISKHIMEQLPFKHKTELVYNGI